jgi:DNA-binding XRE family transcriptional regulator
MVFFRRIGLDVMSKMTYTLNARIMNASKKQRLAKAGWKSGTAAEFLHLTPEEERYVEFKASLCRQLRKQRQKSRLTQEELARMVRSSQSRIAKMEKGDPSVSIDLLVKARTRANQRRGGSRDVVPDLQAGRT